MKTRRITKRKNRGPVGSPPLPERKQPRAMRPRPPWLAALLERLGPLTDRIVEHIPYLANRRQPRYSRREVLQSVPFRNERIEWELDPDGGKSSRPSASRADPAEIVPVVVLRVPRRQDRLGRMMNRFFEGTEYRQVILDELGTEVWQLCDGEASIEELIQALSRKHKLERREVEISLTTYLKTLAKRGFVGLRVPGTKAG